MGQRRCVHRACIHVQLAAYGTAWRKPQAVSVPHRKNRPLMCARACECPCVRCFLWQGMNFVAGALLLACAERDPTINDRPDPPREGSKRPPSSTTAPGGTLCQSRGVVGANVIVERVGGEEEKVGGGGQGGSSSVTSQNSNNTPAGKSTLAGGDHDPSEAGSNSGSSGGKDAGTRQAHAREQELRCDADAGSAGAEGGASAANVADVADDCGEEEDAPPKEWRSGPQHQKAEEDVFWLMMALTSRLPDVGSGLGMRELWLPGVPQLKVIVCLFLRWLFRAHHCSPLLTTQPLFPLPP